MTTDLPQWRIDVDARKGRADAQRKARKLLAGKLYNEWLIAGRPAISVFAREHGVQRTKMDRLLSHAERGWPWGKRRLWFTRTRDYRTNEEQVRDLPDPEEP